MNNRPNIILLMTDQLRCDALGCYGNTICRTPNLDAMAANGICFENAFTVSPVCSPARASLMTGLYPHNHGVMLNTHIAPAWNRGLSPKIQTFASLLKRTGYSLDYVGKWHVHEDYEPCEFGFNRYEKGGGRKKAIPDTAVTTTFANGRTHVLAGTNELPEKETRLHADFEQGIAMMRERARERSPFFLRIDVREPHPSYLPPEPYASMYDPAHIPPWPNFHDPLAGKPDGHLRKCEEWGLVGKDWKWWSQIVAKYYGEVTHIDACVGKLLRTVDELGLTDSTIILFSTDHGDAVGSHNHFTKGGTMYDEIFRIPLLVKGPPNWVSPGKVTQFVTLMDLMPTFVQWAGAKLETPIDGRSLVSMIAGETVSPWPDSVYCESHGEVWGYFSQRMVRTSRWKYVYAPNTRDELYDLCADPAELHNLIDSPDHEHVLKEMKARLLGWNDATGDMFQWPWVRCNFPEPIHPYHEEAKL